MRVALHDLLGGSSDTQAGRAPAMADRLKSINDELRGKDLDAGPWLPLESNPEVFTSFARKVGLPEPWEFVDVFGLDPELLGMIPGAVAAVIVLFPCTERIYAARAVEERALRAEQTRNGVSEAAAAAYHLEQVASFGNACGTIAAVHVLANADIGGMAGPITRFREDTASQTSSERGQALLTTQHLKQESDEAAKHACAQTECPDRDGPDLDHHYCAFVPVTTAAGGQHVVELDGARCDSILPRRIASHRSLAPRPHGSRY
eukprot:COSAG05_NODE_3794_length_1834_cov_1.688761_1_plen_262_part_00